MREKNENDARALESSIALQTTEKLVMKSREDGKGRCAELTQKMPPRRFVKGTPATNWLTNI